MKKTFWGYDVREADEVIDSLRNQNSVLSSKLTKLNMELAAKSEAEAPVKAVPEDVRRELEKLRAEKAELTARAARLREEARELRRQIAALDRAKEPAAADSPARPDEKETAAPILPPLVVDTHVKAQDVFGKAD